MVEACKAVGKVESCQVLLAVEVLSIVLCKYRMVVYYAFCKRQCLLQSSTVPQLPIFTVDNDVSPDASQTTIYANIRICGPSCSFRWHAVYAMD
jgi:hypothetical protein